MRVKRCDVISDLLDPRSMVMHGFSAKEIRSLSPKRLMEVFNLIIEPIDEGEPYTLADETLDDFDISMRIAS